jgi:hypothetical protein
MNTQRIIVKSARWTWGSRLLGRCLDWWGGHPTFDIVLTIIVVGAHWLMVYQGKFGDILAWAGTTGQTATFAAGAGVMSLIAGFAGIGITQYGTSSGEAMDYVRREYGKVIRHNWLDIISWLLISSVLCIIALALDTHPKGPARWVFEVAFVIALLKFFRLVILFRLILVATDRQASGTLTPPRIGIRE